MDARRQSKVIGSSALVALGLASSASASTPDGSAMLAGGSSTSVPAGRASSADSRAPRSGERGAENGLALLTAKALVVGEHGDTAIDNAVILVRNGKIENVGPARDLPIPADDEVIDCGERWIAPGFVDLHCHIAAGATLADINDLVFMTNPELRVSCAVEPENPALKLAVAGGVTTVLFIPGSGSNMGGMGILLKTGMPTYDAMVVRDPGSLKLAQAGNPERWTIGVGRSHMNWNSRNTFERGLAYARMRKEAEDGNGPPVERNIQWDVFPRLFDHSVQVSTHTQRYQVVLATLTMVKKELGLDVYIDHGEWFGSKLAAYAKKLGVDAIIGPREIDAPSSILDTDGRILGIAASYQANGHDHIGFNTDSPVVPEEELSLQAAVGVRYGFDDRELQSLRGLTIVPATTAGISARVGSIAVGKDADLIVTRGDPVDPRTSIETVFIEGKRVYDAQTGIRRW